MCECWTSILSLPARGFAEATGIPLLQLATAATWKQKNIGGAKLRLLENKCFNFCKDYGWGELLIKSLLGSNARLQRKVY